MRQFSHFFAMHNGPAAGASLALGFLYRNLIQQATLAAYIDDFRLLACLSLLCLPFLFFFRNTGKPRPRTRGPVPLSKTRSATARQKGRNFRNGRALRMVKYGSP